MSRKNLFSPKSPCPDIASTLEPVNSLKPMSLFSTDGVTPVMETQVTGAFRDNKTSVVLKLQTLGYREEGLRFQATNTGLKVSFSDLVVDNYKIKQSPRGLFTAPLCLVKEQGVLAGYDFYYTKNLSVPLSDKAEYVNSIFDTGTEESATFSFGDYRIHTSVEYISSEQVYGLSLKVLNSYGDLIYDL